MFKVNNEDIRTTSITPEPAKSYETLPEVRQIQVFETHFHTVHPNPVQREKIKLNFHFDTTP